MIGVLIVVYFLLFVYQLISIIQKSIQDAFEYTFKNLPLYRGFEDISNSIGTISRQVGIRAPAVKIIESPNPGAAALCLTRNYSAILVTDFLLNNYSKGEVQSILAHEFAHIYYQDWISRNLLLVCTRLCNFFFIFAAIYLIFNVMVVPETFDSLPVAVIVAFPLLLSFSLLLLMFALSRWQEYRADVFVVTVVGFPYDFIRALEKMNAHKQKQNAKVSEDVYGKKPDKIQNIQLSWIEQLFKFHPLIEERIKRLREMGIS